MTDIVERIATARDMIELERAAADAIDEIERLRIDLDRAERMASLVAAASSIAGEAVRKMREAEAEIERLRGLLREIAQEPFDSEPYLGADLSRRIREALGDVPLPD